MDQLWDQSNLVEYLSVRSPQRDRRRVDLESFPADYVPSYSVVGQSTQQLKGIQSSARPSTSQACLFSGCSLLQTPPKLDQVRECGIQIAGSQQNQQQLQHQLQRNLSPFNGRSVPSVQYTQISCEQLNPFMDSRRAPTQHSSFGDSLTLEEPIELTGELLDEDLRQQMLQNQWQQRNQKQQANYAQKEFAMISEQQQQLLKFQQIQQHLLTKQQTNSNNNNNIANQICAQEKSTQKIHYIENERVEKPARIANSNEHDQEPSTSSQSPHASTKEALPRIGSTVLIKGVSKTMKNASILCSTNNNYNNNNNNSSGNGGCNCKKSKCLKLYCECFARDGYCSDTCKCTECGNRKKFEQRRQKAVKDALDRNPNAFTEHFVNIQATQIDQGTSLQHTQAPRKGCSCKRTKCLKKYCECYLKGLKCLPELCKCDDCCNCSATQQVLGTVLAEKKSLMCIKHSEKMVCN